MPIDRFQRNTKQRQVMLEELRHSKSHPTAVELYEIVRRRLPRISLGTVYRNLDTLVQMGMVRKVVGDGRQARYDGNTERHYHIRCVKCDRVDDVHDLLHDPVSGDFQNLRGFRVLGYRLEFQGICPECGSGNDRDDTGTSDVHA